MGRLNQAMALSRADQLLVRTQEDTQALLRELIVEQRKTNALLRAQLGAACPPELRP